MSAEITKENFPIVLALCAAIILILVLFFVWFLRFRRTAVSSKSKPMKKCDVEQKKEEQKTIDRQVSQQMRAYNAETRRLEKIGTFEIGVNPSGLAEPQNPNLSHSRSETIAEFENRVNQQMAAVKILDDIREQDEPPVSHDGDDELTPTVIRHPHVMRHLQKTDSRIAMYGGEPFYDVDLNPSLKSVED